MGPTMWSWRHLGVVLEDMLELSWCLLRPCCPSWTHFGGHFLPYWPPWRHRGAVLEAILPVMEGAVADLKMPLAFVPRSRPYLFRGTLVGESLVVTPH